MSGPLRMNKSWMIYTEHVARMEAMKNVCRMEQIAWEI
jgi:hypothetical protein